jgi:ABC-type uncharacterized transport system substrate-binding protein
MAGIHHLPPHAVVAFGSRAAGLASAAGNNKPVIASMILDDEERDPGANASGAKPTAVLSLEIPFEAALKNLMQLFPRTRRIAVVHRASKSASRLAEWQLEAHQFGVTLRLVPCSGPRDLLEALAPLRNEVDFLWTLPDASLYQPAIITPLILDSIRRGLPMIGFSEGFVRAGATVGFFPDYRDIGAQTADLLLQIEGGRAVPPRQVPRTIRAAVNERALRLLGLEYRRQAAPGGLAVIR